MATKDELDLAQLGDTYDILGQMGDAGDAQVALATRRADGLPVLIAAYREPKGDEGNALSHLASDAKLLAAESHPGIVRVLDSHWIGNALAIVMERVTAPTLEERLVRREEQFPYPRVATLLREVNAVLDWARDRRVVHRAVRADSVFVEEGSDRVRVMFVPQPLSHGGVPDEHDDARTVASLARAMLTRSVADPERDRLPLAELRPGLPSRVVQQTEALLGRAESLEPVDVRAYIAGIAMSEELRRGEDECNRVTREMSEEQRVTREQLAAERKAHEEDLAEQARRFEAEKEEILKSMAREREETAKAMAQERAAAEKQLRQERERFEKEMQKQRSAFAREMEKQRSALEKERMRIARSRERLERDLQRIEQDRQRVEQERQRLAQERDRLKEDGAAAIGAAAVGAALPALSPLEADPELDREVELPEEKEIGAAGDELVARDRLADAGDAEYTGAPEERDAPWSASGDPDDDVDDARAPMPRRGFVAGAAPSVARPSAAPSGGRLARAKRLLRDRRIAGAAVAMLILVVAVAALALGRRGDAGELRTADRTRPAGLRVVDSLSGLAVPPSPLDSAMLPDSATPEVTAPAPRRVREERPADRPSRPEPTVRAETTFTAPGTTTTPASLAPTVDTMPAPVPPLPFTRTDTMLRQEPLPRPDTTVRRDTAPRRDSIAPRRDTMPATPGAAAARSTP